MLSVPRPTASALALPPCPPRWSVSGAALTVIGAARTAFVFFLELYWARKLRTPLPPAAGLAVLAVTPNALHFAERLNCWVPFFTVVENLQLKLTSSTGQDVFRCLF